MPALVGIVAHGIGVILGYLRQQQQSQSLDRAWTALTSTAGWIDWFSRFVAEVFSAAKGGEDASEQWSANVRDDLAKLGDDLKTITEHTYDVVIPHSLSYLNGYVFSHGIVPLRNTVSSIEKEMGALSGRVSVLEFWRRDYADPHIRDWRRFNSWFHEWPIGVVTQWHEWFQHPHDFALWAAAPMIGPLVSYLAADEHKQTRDNLGLIILDSWTEDTRSAWEAWLRFMV